MAHNYYEDYKIQYEHNRKNGSKPELSELVVSGMAYCTAILLNANQVRHYAYTENRYRVKGLWQGAAGAINSARGNLLTHDFEGALATSNDISLFDIPKLVDSMRREFDILSFDSEYIKEALAASGVQSDSNAAQALFSVFPPAATNKIMNPGMMHVLSRANVRAVSSRESWTADMQAEMAVQMPYPSELGKFVHRDTPFIITAHNPLFLPILGMAYADVAATKIIMYGQLTPGPVDRGLKFTDATKYTFPINRAEHNKFIMLRRLRRAGGCYVPGFDLYLTYLTDFCRLLEVILPEEVALKAVQDAEKFATARESIRRGLQPYQ